jgi:hypothetical protein
LRMEYKKYGQIEIKTSRTAHNRPFYAPQRSWGRAGSVLRKPDRVERRKDYRPLRCITRPTVVYPSMQEVYTNQCVYNNLCEMPAKWLKKLEIY